MLKSKAYENIQADKKLYDLVQL